MSNPRKADDQQSSLPVGESKRPEKKSEPVASLASLSPDIELVDAGRLRFAFSKTDSGTQCCDHSAPSLEIKAAEASSITLSLVSSQKLSEQSFPQDARSDDDLRSETYKLYDEGCQSQLTDQHQKAIDAFTHAIKNLCSLKNRNEIDLKGLDACHRRLANENNRFGCTNFEPGTYFDAIKLFYGAIEARKQVKNKTAGDQVELDRYHRNLATALNIFGLKKHKADNSDEVIKLFYGAIEARNQVKNKTASDQVELDLYHRNVADILFFYVSDKREADNSNNMIMLLSSAIKARQQIKNQTENDQIIADTCHQSLAHLLTGLGIEKIKIPASANYDEAIELFSASIRAIQQVKNQTAEDQALLSVNYRCLEICLAGFGSKQRDAGNFINLFSKAVNAALSMHSLKKDNIKMFDKSLHSFHDTVSPEEFNNFFNDPAAHHGQTKESFNAILSMLLGQLLKPRNTQEDWEISKLLFNQFFDFYRKINLFGAAFQLCKVISFINEMPVENKEAVNLLKFTEQKAFSLPGGEQFYQQAKEVKQRFGFDNYRQSVLWLDYPSIRFITLNQSMLFEQTSLVPDLWILIISFLPWFPCSPMDIKQLMNPQTHFIHAREELVIEIRSSSRWMFGFFQDGELVRLAEQCQESKSSEQVINHLAAYQRSHEDKKEQIERWGKQFRK